MATIVKLKNGNFCCQVFKNKKRKSKTFKTKLEAQKWGIEQEQLITGNIAQGYSLKDACKRYAEEESHRKKGHRWEVIRLNKLQQDPLCMMELNTIKTDDMQDWINRRSLEVAPGSVIREFQIICSVLKCAKLKWKWLSSEPYKNVSLPRKPPPRDRRISAHEIAAVLDALQWIDDDTFTGSTYHYIAVAFQLAIETAMRWGEIWGLTWDRIFLDKRFLTLVDTKNGGKRDVPLSRRAVELLQILEEFQKEEVKAFPKNATSANTLFRKAVKKAGIENLHFHDTRHEGLTRLARKLDVLDLARMVGHKDPRSLMIYYNATAEEIATRLD